MFSFESCHVNNARTRRSREIYALIFGRIHLIDNVIVARVCDLVVPYVHHGCSFPQSGYMTSWAISASCVCLSASTGCIRLSPTTTHHPTTTTAHFPTTIAVHLPTTTAVHLSTNSATGASPVLWCTKPLPSSVSPSNTSAFIPPVQQSWRFCRGRR
jgi:hypothetical protein